MLAYDSRNGIEEMTLLALSFLRDNSELRGFSQSQSHLQSAQSRRSAVRIAVIDDEVFAPQANLRSYGYSVEPIGDVKNVSEIIQYQIVLCDIMGVGRHFDTSLQGASLISEIKKNYPEKYVIAYTGAALNERAARLATSRADKTLKKDVEIEEWISTLDKASAEVTDPYIIWNKIRYRFIEIGVRTKDILHMEHLYVKSVTSQDSNLSQLTGKLTSTITQPDARAIIQNLAASLIFKAIFGA